MRSRAECAYHRLPQAVDQPVTISLQTLFIGFAIRRQDQHARMMVIEVCLDGGLGRNTVRTKLIRGKPMSNQGAEILTIFW